MPAIKLKTNYPLISILVCLLPACAAIDTKPHTATDDCKYAKTDETKIDCHWQAIYYRLRAKWWLNSNNLTISDFPNVYRIKTKISVDPKGRIIDFSILKKSESYKLNRSVKRSLKQSSPLPVPNEPLFSKGGFSEFYFDYANTDIEPAFDSLAEMTDFILCTENCLEDKKENNSENSTSRQCDNPGQKNCSDDTQIQGTDTSGQSNTKDRTYQGVSGRNR